MELGRTGIIYRPVALDELRARLNDALHIAYEHGQAIRSDEALWTVDQIVRALTGPEYGEWVRRYQTLENGEPIAYWNVGVAPWGAVRPLRSVAGIRK